MFGPSVVLLMGITVLPRAVVVRIVLERRRCRETAPSLSGLSGGACRRVFHL
jgi:hypothetical protein